MPLHSEMKPDDWIPDKLAHQGITSGQMVVRILCEERQRTCYHFLEWYDLVWVGALLERATVRVVEE